MSLLDDARRLVEADPLDRDGCVWCENYVEHTPDCPWLSMPRIVAALEAAEHVIRTLIRNPRLIMIYAEKTAVERLEAALNGDVVPQESEKPPS